MYCTVRNRFKARFAAEGATLIAGATILRWCVCVCGCVRDVWTREVEEVKKGEVEPKAGLFLQFRGERGNRGHSSTRPEHRSLSANYYAH